MVIGFRLIAEQGIYLDHALSPVEHPRPAHEDPGLAALNVRALHCEIAFLGNALHHGLGSLEALIAPENCVRKNRVATKTAVEAASAPPESRVSNDRVVPEIPLGAAQIKTTAIPTAMVIEDRIIHHLGVLGGEEDPASIS